MSAEEAVWRYVPPLVWALPFVALLLIIALAPLIEGTRHRWERNLNKLLVSAVLGLVTLAYYGLVHPGSIDNHFTGRHASTPGAETVLAVLSNAILVEFVPFIVLLFALYVISGGIHLGGDLPAHPWTNTAFLGVGTLLASFIGTTGAAMILIRPLLATNSERRHKVHTFVFFIFMVCNTGGLLLPIGDPPLFLGYLRGVPFTWTLRLLPYWLGVNLALLAVYFFWDKRAHEKEEPINVLRDEIEVRPLRLLGTINFAYLLGVVLCVALIVPGKPLPGTTLDAPIYLREALMLLLVVLSLWTTPATTRRLNRFDYAPILEVAAVFSGIFVCMQVPVEILHARGAELGIDTAREFFWATGVLSSLLDNAPTYVVFFETAASLKAPPGAALLALSGGRTIAESSLAAISLGAVLMGANTYIGNGPNFMVRSIAEQSGVRMPSFFGYVGYSALILIPLFVVLTLAL